MEKYTRKPIYHIQTEIYIETDKIDAVTESLSQAIEYWIKVFGLKRHTAEGLGLGFPASCSNGISYSAVVYPQEQLMSDSSFHNIN